MNQYLHNNGITWRLHNNNWTETQRPGPFRLARNGTHFRSNIRIFSILIFGSRWQKFVLYLVWQSTNICLPQAPADRSRLGRTTIHLYTCFFGCPRINSAVPDMTPFHICLALTLYDLFVCFAALPCRLRRLPKSVYAERDAFEHSNRVV